MGFGVSIFSYAGEVVVGFSTDAVLMPDPDRLVDLMLAEVETLREALGVGAPEPSSR
jgi:hypothetical protein